MLVHQRHRRFYVPVALLVGGFALSICLFLGGVVGAAQGIALTSVVGALVIYALRWTQWRCRGSAGIGSRRTPSTTRHPCTSNHRGRAVRCLRSAGRARIPSKGDADSLTSICASWPGSHTSAHWSGSSDVGSCDRLATARHAAWTP